MCVLKGASGTGKGTRVSQLLEYMKTLDSPVMFRSSLSSKLDAGLLFPKLGFCLLVVMSSPTSQDLRRGHQWTTFMPL